MPKVINERLARVDKVNDLVHIIADRGHRFFYNEKKNAYARMYMDVRGRLWWQDDYTDKLIYLHYKYWKRGFSHGGTMRQVVNMLKRYVLTGVPLPPHIFGPWSETLCNGDLWGYGKDNMEIIREEAAKLFGN